MTFKDVIHHVAEIGEHMVEFIDGEQSVKLNGALVTGPELVQLVETLGEAARALGLIPAAA